MLTTEDLCARLKLSDRTVLQLLRDGKIRGTKVGGGPAGGMWRVTEEDLTAYLEREDLDVPA